MDDIERIKRILLAIIGRIALINISQEDAEKLIAEVQKIGKDGK